VPCALLVSDATVYICRFRMILSVNVDYFLNSVNKLIVVKVKCDVLFEVWTELLSRPTI
jgi:hypothetical protein